MTQTLPLSMVKIQLSKLVENILRRDDEILITRNGKPAAVLLSAEEYASWKETREIKANPALMQEIAEGLKSIQHGKGKKYASIEKLFGSSAE